ncbi:MAG TPA: hypothetical protein VH684_21480 [Xanthobacteraceae bacterium]
MTKLIAASRAKQLVGLILCCTIGEAIGSSSACAATASGPSALALAAVVAAHSGSLLGGFDRRALSRLFDGKRPIIRRVNKITVAVDSIVCKTSNVDITARSCELTFKNHKRNLNGRDANEIYGTLAVAGVMSEGAAGSITESIMKLECTIDPAVIEQKSGGGATCTFETGQ